MTPTDTNKPWTEFEDDLSDAIGDSLEQDWTPRDGARAVVEWLNENHPQAPAAPDMAEALEAADQFITNGIELGYIRMPDADTPDPAHKTPGMIRAALQKARGGES